MRRTIILSFLAGILAGNAFPHFVRGITKENYPNVIGNTPTINFIAGWSGLSLAVVVASQANGKRFPLAAFISNALGVLLMGLFHAGPGAFGKKS